MWTSAAFIDNTLYIYTFLSDMMKDFDLEAVDLQYSTAVLMSVMMVVPIHGLIIFDLLLSYELSL